MKHCEQEFANKVLPCAVNVNDLGVEAYYCWVYTHWLIGHVHLYCLLAIIVFIHQPFQPRTLHIERCFYLQKKTLRSSQDSNLGPLNSSQMLLPMSYWSSGIGAEDRWHLSIDTVRFSGWISLRLGELCRISTLYCHHVCFKWHIGDPS